MLPSVLQLLKSTGLGRRRVLAGRGAAALLAGLRPRGQPGLNNYASLKPGSALELQPWQAVVLDL